MQYSLSNLTIDSIQQLDNLIEHINNIEKFSDTTKINTKLSNISILFYGYNCFKTNQLASDQVIDILQRLRVVIFYNKDILTEFKSNLNLIVNRPPTISLNHVNIDKIEKSIQCYKKTLTYNLTDNDYDNINKLYNILNGFDNKHALYLSLNSLSILQIEPNAIIFKNPLLNGIITNNNNNIVFKYIFANKKIKEIFLNSLELKRLELINQI